MLTHGLDYSTRRNGNTLTCRITGYTPLLYALKPMLDTLNYTEFKKAKSHIKMSWPVVLQGGIQSKKKNPTKKKKGKQ